MFLSENVLNSLRTERGFKPTTVKNIDNSLKRIFKNVFNTDRYNPDMLYRINDIETFLNTLKNSVAKTITNSILAVISLHDSNLNDLKQPYTEIFEQYVKKHTTEYVVAPVSDRDKKKYLSLEALAHKRDLWLDVYKKSCHLDTSTDTGTNDSGNEITLNENCSKIIYQKYLVASLYTYLPPLRGQEYFNCHFQAFAFGTSDNTYIQYVKQSESNLLDIVNWKLIVAFYKTQSKYNIRIITLPPILVRVIKPWIQLNDSVDNWFLINMKNEQMTTSTFTHFLKRTFGNDISVDMLRKIYISEIIRYITNDFHFKQTDDSSSLSGKMALIMAHAVETQRTVYNKFGMNIFNISSPVYMNSVINLLTQTNVVSV